jgi:hypothetical protein
MGVQGQRALLQNAGPYNENTLVGVPDEVNTGEEFGSGEKVNVCKFPLGSVNAWNVRRLACSLHVWEEDGCNVMSRPGTLTAEEMVPYMCGRRLGA